MPDETFGVSSTTTCGPRGIVAYLETPNVSSGWTVQSSRLSCHLTRTTPLLIIWSVSSPHPATPRQPTEGRKRRREEDNTEIFRFHFPSSMKKEKLDIFSPFLAFPNYRLKNCYY